MDLNAKFRGATTNKRKSPESNLQRVALFGIFAVRSLLVYNYWRDGETGAADCWPIYGSPLALG